MVDQTYQNITIQQQANNSFVLEEFSFGKVTDDGLGYNSGSGYTPSSAYFSMISLSNKTQPALIATNFRGLGLPYYLWYSVINKIIQLDSTFAQDLVCSEGPISGCTLPNPCVFYEFWNAGYAFKIKFAGSDNYNIMPLSAISFEGEGECALDLNYFNGDS